MGFLFNTLFVAMSAYIGIKVAQAIKAVSETEHSHNNRIFSTRGKRKVDKSCVLSDHSYFLNKDNLYIFWQKWLPKEPPQAIVVLVHGLNDHCGRYEHVIKALNEMGVAVYTLDHQGHGKSEGDRLFVRKTEDYVDDVLNVTKMAEEDFPDLKKFVLGHSMGGLIATLVTLRAQDRFAGTILSAPALYVDPKETPKWLQNVLVPVSNAFPKLRLVRLDISTISRDKNVFEQYLADPLVSDLKPTLKLQASLLAGMDICQSRFNEIKLPLLVCHGTGDKMVPIEGSRMIKEQSSSEDKSLIEYEGAFHELFNEPDAKDHCLQDVLNWVESHI